LRFRVSMLRVLGFEIRVHAVTCARLAFTLDFADQRWAEATCRQRAPRILILCEMNFWIIFGKVPGFGERFDYCA
jgi:hypothetical protein